MEPKQDICPKCGEQLMYGEFKFNGVDGGSQYVECPSCESHGFQFFSVKFESIDFENY